MDGNNFVPPTDADVVEKGFVPPSDAVEKKNPVSNASTQPVQQPTKPSVQNGIEGYKWTPSGGTSTPVQMTGTTSYVGGVNPVRNIEKETTDKAVSSSKQLTKSLNSYNAAKADADSYVSYDKLQNSYPQLFQGVVPNLDAIAIYDDQSGKYVPKDTFITGEDGVVRSRYTKEQIEDFNKQYRDVQRKPTLEMPSDPNARIDAINKMKVAQNEAAAAYNADYAELTKQVDALKAIKQERMGEYGIDDAFMDGMAQTSTSIRIAMKAASGNNEELQDELERMYVNQMSQPDKPLFMFAPTTPLAMLGNKIAAPAAEMLGGQIEPLAATTISTLATGGIGGATTAMSMYGTMGYGGNLAQGYIQARSQGKLPEEALEIGKDYAKFGAGTGAVEGAIGFINPFMKAGGLVNKTLTQGVKTALIDGGIDGTVAMGMQLANNKYGQSLGLKVDDLDGVLEQGVGEVGFSLAMNALFGGAAKLKPAVHKLLVNGLAQSDVPSIQTVVNQAIQDGTLDAAKGQTALNEIMDAKRGYDKMPVELDEDTKNDILPDMQRKAALEKQLEEKDDAFKPAIESEIETVNRQIQEKIGAPLTLKEQKAYEKLKERKGDSEKPLTASEKAELKHFEKRIDTQEKISKQKTEEDAVQKQETGEGVLRDGGIQREGGLQGVGQQDQPQQATEPSPEIASQAEEVTSITDTEQPTVEKQPQSVSTPMPENAASIFEEHSNKRGNFAKDKVLEKMGGLKDKAITITDNFDSMIADLQARADKGEVAFRIDC